MKKYTITEYAKKIGKSREAVFYQIKKKKIQAKKNKNNEWEIFIEDKEKDSDEKSVKIEAENQILKEKIRGLETELANKNEIIKAKNEIIEAEKRTNIALLTTIEHQKILIQKPKKSFFSKLLFWKENK